MSISPARLLALSQIDQRDLPNWEPSTIHRELRPKSIDPRDLDLADRITQGVIKQALVLQRLVAEYSGRKLSQIDEPVQKILAMSLYQLRAMERVPTHAIVSDAVEMTKLVGHRSAATFVNAVLRKASADKAAGKPFVGKNAAERAEKEFSVPKELFARLAMLYGESRALQLCESFDREPPMLGRLIGSTTIDDLRARSISAEPHEQSRIVVLSGLRRAELRELSDAGLVQVQDATSAAVIDALDLRPGQRVLDRCAGRGTKTQQILELIGEGGSVVAMDTSRSRLRSLEQLVERRKISNARSFLAGSIHELPADAREYDRVLIDAPCSNSGVLARRPEARYHQDPREQTDLIALQLQILRDSADAVTVGGRLLYATCSIWSEENEAVIDAFLGADSRFALLSSSTTALQTAESASTYRDGGFVAVLRRDR
jgi:16S rRNA (cytosine967-C5)-methyltransferase